MSMRAVIRRRGLDLAFEENYEGGSFLHNYKPCDHDNARDHTSEDIDIGLKINGSKV